jgi:hypothetical protein
MRIAAPLLALLVLLAGTAPAVALAPSGPDRGDATAAPTPDRPVLVGPSVASIDPPTVTEIYLAPTPDGDARWIVSIRYDLSSDGDRAAFDRYGRTFEAGDTDVGLGVGFFRTLVSQASRATGREMSIQRPRRNATVDDGTGVLRLSFTWTNFVTDTADGFRIDDAVLMPGNRTWLTSITSTQRLVVETPPGYRVTDTRFGLENGSVVVEGPHTFQEPLAISYRETAGEEPASETPWLLIAGALLVGLGLVAAVVYVRRRDTEGAPAVATDAGTPGADGDEPVSEPGAEGDGSIVADGDETAAERSGAPNGDDEATGVDDGDGTTDPSLLSDEERVERLLDRNGGRMKQARIVRETGWSDAKVSQLLSTMAEDGRVEKLRLGRENLISLPDQEP